MASLRRSTAGSTCEAEMTKPSWIFGMTYSTAIRRFPDGASGVIDFSTVTRFLPVITSVTASRGTVSVKAPSASLFAVCSPFGERAVIVAPATASFLLVTITPVSARPPPDCASVWAQNSEIKIGSRRRFFMSRFPGYDRIALFPHWRLRIYRRSGFPLSQALFKYNWFKYEPIILCHKARNVSRLLNTFQLV